jgi:DNA-binding FrmR family transcriptional regulator
MIGFPGATTRIGRMDGRDVPDRQLDALLARLDRIAEQLERIDGRLEAQEGFLQVTRELRALTDSLNAVAYAALGQSPRVRRRAG